MKELSLKEDSYCIYYTTIGSDTYSNGTASAKEAGYSEHTARSTSWKLQRRPKIRERIQQLQAENMSRNYLTTDKVLSDLEDTRIKGVKKKDLASAIRCSELQGKFFAMFSERTIWEREQQAGESTREFTEEESEDLREMANMLAKRKLERERDKIHRQEVG